ncbi:EI24 domain-containing protein [Sphingomonas sp. ASV193]|uniref:EI24 domain-containing protein n=1 Tax=Sphingomonas sp. ASV193 TaxID=3144405 RepID=UPI0032E8D503
MSRAQPATALSLAFADLWRPAMLGILARVLLITLAVFAVIFVVAAWALTGVDPCDWLGGECPLDPWSGGVASLAATVLLGWFLFPGVAIGVASGMGDRISAAVEAIHYPDAAVRARPLSLGRGMSLALRSGGRLMLYNLIALPVALLLLVTGVGPFILFALVNGLSLGRDFGELAAGRFMAGRELRDWLRANRWALRAVGLAIGGLLLVPIVNLVAPLLGAAAAVHLYQRSVRA